MDAGAFVSPEEKRERVFRSVPVFSHLPEKTLDRLMNSADETAYASGSPIVEEGSVADGLYLIAEGEAEVSVSGAEGRMPMCILSDGDLFGEVAMLRAGRRSATVTALSPVVAYRISTHAFDALIAADPVAYEALDALSDQMLIASFLKRASPFTKLQIEGLRDLCTRVQEVVLEGGEIVFRQGDRGDACYLIRSGRVEVIRHDRAEARRVDVVGQGSMFGEAALLTDAPRNATVRTVEPSKLLSIGREDFFRVIGSDARVAGMIVELLHHRERPTRARKVTIHERASDEGETVTVLQDEIRQGIYFQLSPLGRFVWSHLDGRHNVREIAEACRAEFGAVEERNIAEIIAGLMANGFAFSRSLSPEVRETVEHKPWWKRLFSRLSLGG